MLIDDGRGRKSPGPGTTGMGALPSALDDAERPLLRSPPGPAYARVGSTWERPLFWGANREAVRLVSARSRQMPPFYFAPK